MSSPDRFKPYLPDVQAVVRLEEAWPPEHPIHVFIDLVQGVDLDHFAIPPTVARGVREGVEDGRLPGARQPRDPDLHALAPYLLVLDDGQCLLVNRTRG